MSKKVSNDNVPVLFPKTINILGTDYECVLAIESEDPDLANKYGYIWYRMQRIVIKDLRRDPNWSKDPQEVCLSIMKETLRHEILHGFLFESGLSADSLQYSNGWAKNEEMIDWFAIQSPKIFRIYQEVGCL